MNHWFTMHYPHVKPGHPYFIYLQAMAGVAADASPGDKIAFYETAGKDRRGCCGVIAFAEVVARVVSSHGFHGSEPEAEGRSFPYMIRCGPPELDGFVPVGKVRSITGKKVMMIKGGTMRISREVFQRLRDEFNRNAVLSKAVDLPEDHWHPRGTGRGGR